MSATVHGEGFDAFDRELANYMKAAEPDHVVEILKAGADQLVADVRSLPKPRSRIAKAGYTHLLDSVTGEEAKVKGDYVVGWAKYYGPIVEKGHVTPKGTHVSARAHLKPTYRQNRDKYVAAMQKKLEEIGG